MVAPCAATRASSPARWTPLSSDRSGPGGRCLYIVLFLLGCRGFRSIFVNVDVDLDHFRCYLMMRSRVRRWLSFCIFVRVHLDRCRLQVKHALVKTTYQDQVTLDSHHHKILAKKLPTWLLAFVLAPPPVLEFTSEPAPLLS